MPPFALVLHGGSRTALFTILEQILINNDEGNAIHGT
jgi:hypothetical protein